ncbi:MAG: hypothetical protein WCH74_13460, partial [Chloroflexota bacterium]
MNRMASRAATALTAVALAVVASIAPQATVSAAFTGWHGTTDGAPVTVTLGGNGFPGIVGFECQQEIRYGVEVTTQVRATVTIENANNVKRAFHDVSRDPFVGDWLADGSGTCKVIVQQARGQTGTASVRIWASPNDPVVMAADGTPIALVVSIPTQFSRATFPCTKGVQYPISLASSLPTSAYTARVFVPATATSWTNRTFQTSVKVTPKATGTCSVNFDPTGTTLGSAMVTVQGPSTP